jgi:hypothetical protein
MLGRTGRDVKDRVRKDAQCIVLAQAMLPKPRRRPAESDSEKSANVRPDVQITTRLIWNCNTIEIMLCPASALRSAVVRVRQALPPPPLETD